MNARSMKRSASMGRATSRSAARGKAKARAMGRARRGGEEHEGDIKMGIKEQDNQNLIAMEEGRSPSPPNMPGEVYYNTDPDNMDGGKRRRSKKFYKGKASKTQKGRQDFVTHKEDKFYNRKGHRQTKRQRKSKGLFEQLFGL